MRTFAQDRKQKQLTSWQTRMLSVMIANGYMVAKGETNTALEAAMKMAIDDIEAAQLEDQESAQKQKLVTEPPVGSFERIMGRFGAGFTGMVPMGGGGEDGGSS